MFLNGFYNLGFCESGLFHISNLKLAIHATFNWPNFGEAYNILSIIPSLMLLGAGISKVMKSEEMVKNFSSIPNFGDKVQLVGLIILVALSLYWIPKTSKIGFLLLCSFGGGVIVAEIVSGHAPIPGLMLTTLLYVGTILRRPSLIIV